MSTLPGNPPANTIKSVTCRTPGGGGCGLASTSARSLFNGRTCSTRTLLRAILCAPGPGGRRAQDHVLDGRNVPFPLAVIGFDEGMTGA